MWRRKQSVYAILCMVAFTLTTRANDQKLTGYRVADGYDLSIAAEEPMVVNPVTMTFGDDGRLYVAEWRAGRGPNDHIKVLTDSDKDGKFDRAEIYMDGLDLPAGILFYDGWTYLTLDHDLVRFRDDDHDGKFEKRETVVTGFGNDNSHHRVSGLFLGPDGWIYMTTGDSDARVKGTDGSTAAVLRSGGVFRCRPDGSQIENVAFGMRNPWGNIAFSASLEMFHTDNDNEGAPGFTGCRILHVVEGGDYGWRLLEGARCCQPDYERATWNGGRPGRLGWVAETGRGAPAGLCVLESAAFPPSSQGLLIYPDVFRKKIRAYRLRPTGATYGVKDEFELVASEDGLFRPTDAEIAPDGTLYVLDWRTDSGGAGQLAGNGTTGRIYRIKWNGTPTEPALEPFNQARIAGISGRSDSDLVEDLSSKHFPLRLRASQELIRRKSNVTPELARIILDDAKARETRMHALMVLSAQAPSALPGVWKELISRGTDSSLCRVALETIARFGSADDSSLARLLMELLSRLEPSNAHTPEGDRKLRALALALGRFHGLTPERSRPPKPGIVSRQEVIDAILSASTFRLDADAFLRDGFARGIERLGAPNLSEIAQRINDGDVNQRESALDILQAWRGSEGKETLISEIRRPITSTARVGLFRTLREMVESVPPEPIVEWLEGSSEVEDANARVEAIRILKAQRERAAFSAPRVLPRLLEDPDPAVRIAALGLANTVRSAEVKQTLVALTARAHAPVEERRLALVALAGYQDKTLSTLASELLEATADPALKVELLRTLAASDFPVAAAQAERLLTDKRLEIRAAAIAVLGQKPQTALALARLFNEEKLPPEDLPRVVEAVRSYSTPEIQSALQSLLKNKLLAASSGTAAEQLRQMVARRGNAERGKAIYLDSRKGGCVTCHRLEGVGGTVGPDLTKMYETLSFDKRVESILEPSKEIKEGYSTTKIATKDGRTLTGLLVSDTPSGVVLKDASGKEMRIPQEEIEQKQPEKTSLMPAGVVGHLSFDEFSDLLKFLGDKPTQESLRTNK